MSHKKISVAAIVAGFALSACSSASQQPQEIGYGPNPKLPDPEKSLMPTVNIAPAKGWPQGATPTAAAGMKVAAFADKLDHPRWLYVLPDGGVLVAETNSPAKPDDGKGVKAKVQKLVMKRAGAGVETANRITLLRDTDGDGVADQRSV
jgi:glucose/arabinose dehydrogenase